jgi:hypothetical protein
MTATANPDTLMKPNQKTMKSEIESPAPPATSKPKKQRKKPESFHMSHEERFYDLFKLAWLGLHSQFEQPYTNSFEGIGHHYDGGKEELKRSKHLAIRAWNSAVYGCQQFEKDEEVEEFNDTVKMKKVEEK